MSVFLERVLLIQCGLANPIRTPGERTVEPIGYTFHHRCPWGKPAPDTHCLNCQHVAVASLIERDTTEAELDTRQEAAPHEWRACGPELIPRPAATATPASDAGQAAEILELRPDDGTE
jgi:hypothetical protein